MSTVRFKGESALSDVSSVPMRTSELPACSAAPIISIKEWATTMSVGFAEADASKAASLAGSKDHSPAFAIGIVAALALLFLSWPAWRAQLPLELWGNEGWNAYLADAARHGPLYPDPDALIGNNYPPLSFLLIDALSRLFGDALYVGRVLSLAATLGLGGLAAVMVRQLGGARGAAAVAGLWFVATMARFFDTYVGMNDPQLLAQCIMAAGLVWFLARLAAKRAVEPAVLVMVVAGFFKQDIIAMPATALLWLILIDWRRGLRASLFGAVACAVGLALCQAVYQPNFMADLFAPRSYYWDRSLFAVGRLQFVLPALVIWALWAWTERTGAAARFTALFIAVSLAGYLVLKSGAGVDENAQFDLVFAAAVGVGMALARLPSGPLAARWPQARIRAALIAVLVIRLVASSRTEFVHVLFDPDYRALAAQHAAIARAEAARIAAIPGPVACSNLVVCRMAGKPFVLDAFKVQMLRDTGALSDAAYAAAAAPITFVTVDPRANIKSLWHRYPKD